MIGTNEDTSYRIKVVESDKDILSTFTVMKSLRENLKRKNYVTSLKTQQREGFKIVMLAAKDKVKAVGGFRILNNLGRGKFLYVDDLVTKPEDRSKGYGSILFDWLKKYANDNNCKQVVLDSGVQRFGAHKFYLEKGMKIVGHHFSMDL
jgi:GNAT superfamily N-acetyltransferase